MHITFPGLNRVKAETTVSGSPQIPLETLHINIFWWFELSAPSVSDSMFHLLKGPLGQLHQGPVIPMLCVKAAALRVRVCVSKPVCVCVHAGVLASPSLCDA